MPEFRNKEPSNKDKNLIKMIFRSYNENHSFSYSLYMIIKSNNHGLT